MILELNEIEKIINQLEFFELLDLIEILLLKQQQLENTKIIGFKRWYFLSHQKFVAIEKEIDSIQFKIGIVINHLKKSQGDRNWVD